MKSSKICECIGMAIGVVLLVILFVPDVRDKALSMLKTKPYVDLTGNQLTIKEFTWSYGVIGFNQFNGDFDKLDQKVYDLLKGKTGRCRVNLEDKHTDKYGNSNPISLYIGDIDMDELSKYQDWQHWSNNSGIRKLLYNKLLRNEPIQALTIDTTSAYHNSTPVTSVPVLETNPDTGKLTISDTLKKP